MQPDTQREGPAYKLGQGATRDQPQGEGKQRPAGKGADNSQTNKTDTEGPNHTQKEHDDHEKTPGNAQAETPKRQNHKHREATHEGKQEHKTKDKGRQESTAQIKTAPEKLPKRKREATRGQNLT